LALAVVEELFFPARALKSAEEIDKLTAAQRLNQQCFARAREILAAAEIARDKSLVWEKRPLTSETLQTEMNLVALRGGAQEFADGPIVAGGAQGALPHERGHGVLRAEELIVVDCFPRHPNGYWGDLTRTYLKGRPAPWQRDLYAAVQGAQALALSLLKPGAEGSAVHRAVEQFLARAGFETGMGGDGLPYGFFHGTGHAVGLELHDAGPRTLSTQATRLQAGMVTSVEPGLYYPGKGGCRIEDVVAITENGYQNLTTLDKDDWIID
jgi:Xaa-Pro aminopeptidase